MTFDRMIGSRIKELREARGLPQSALADAVNTRGERFTQQIVGKIENGQRSLKYQEAILIAHILRVPVGVFWMTGESATDEYAELDVKFDNLNRVASRADRALWELLEAIAEVEVVEKSYWKVAGGSDTDPNRQDAYSIAQSWMVALMSVNVQVQYAHKRMGDKFTHLSPAYPDLKRLLHLYDNEMDDEPL